MGLSVRVKRYALEYKSCGGVAEWSIAPVLKTGNGKPFVSSNLTASARMLSNTGPRTGQKRTVMRYHGLDWYAQVRDDRL